MQVVSETKTDCLSTWRGQRFKHSPAPEKKSRKSLGCELSRQPLPKGQKFLSVGKSCLIPLSYTETNLRNAITKFFFVEEDISFIKSKAPSFLALLQLLRTDVARFSPKIPFRATFCVGKRKPVMSCINAEKLQIRELALQRMAGR